MNREDEQVLTRMSTHTVSPRKSAGPDRVPGRALKDCAEQLAEEFTRIFKLSLGKVPETSYHIVSAKENIGYSNNLNNYRPVALTPIIMKCFERLTLSHIKATIPASLDSH